MAGQAVFVWHEPACNFLHLPAVKIFSIPKVVDEHISHPEDGFYGKIFRSDAVGNMALMALDRIFVLVHGMTGFLKLIFVIFHFVAGDAVLSGGCPRHRKREKYYEANGH